MAIDAERVAERAIVNLYFALAELDAPSGEPHAHKLKAKRQIQLAIIDLMSIALSFRNDFTADISLYELIISS